MKFCDVKTVGELIDALQHYPKDKRIEIVCESYARCDIVSVELVIDTACSFLSSVVQIVAENN